MSTKTTTSQNVNDAKWWGESRHLFVGSSEISTIFGLNKWQTPLELWARKTKKIESPIEENDQMWLGKVMEPVVGGLFTKRTGIELESAQVRTFNSKYPVAMGTPDFWELDEGRNRCGILECKTSTYHALSSWTEYEAPRYAFMQIMWQLGICELQKGHVAGLIGGSAKDFYAPAVEFNQDVFDQMYEMAEMFIKHVREDTPPKAMAGDVKLIEQLVMRQEGTKELLNWCYPLCEKMEKLQKDKAELMSKVKDFDFEIDACQAVLLQELGDKTDGVIGNYTIKAKRIERKGFEVKPSAYTKFTLKNTVKDNGAD